MKAGFYESRKAMFTSDKNYWETPQEFFELLNTELNFTLDPCSSHANAKCEKHYTVEEDGLSQDWSGEVVFCNPPHGRAIGDWVKKSSEEAEKGATVVLLIPARTDTAYFHDYIYGKAEIRFLRGRLKFEQNGKAGQSAPFPSMIAIWR